MLRRPFPASLVCHLFSNSMLLLQTKFCNSHFPWTLCPQFVLLEPDGVYGDKNVCSFIACARPINCHHYQLLKKIKCFQFLSFLLCYCCIHNNVTHEDIHVLISVTCKYFSSQREKLQVWLKIFNSKSILRCPCLFIILGDGGLWVRNGSVTRKPIGIVIQIQEPMSKRSL